jgi:hypothetical protein
MKLQVCSSFLESVPSFFYYYFCSYLLIIEFSFLWLFTDMAEREATEGWEISSRGQDNMPLSG